MFSTLSSLLHTGGTLDRFAYCSASCIDTGPFRSNDGKSISGSLSIGDYVDQPDAQLLTVGVIGQNDATES